MKPFFSIIIPLYNKEKQIKDTLQSVLAQTFQDFEIIVINDGSTDSSLAIVENINDDRIHIHSIENSGVSRARNTGVTKAKADYLAFLDADDFWKESHLENLKNLIINFPDCGLYATAYLKRHKANELYCKFNGIPKNEAWQGVVSDYFASSINNSIAWSSAVVVPNKILHELGDFDESITLGAGEDIDLWIRIAMKYPVAFNNKITAIHNLHAENRISNSNTNIRAFINLDKYEDAAKVNPSLKKYLDWNRFSIGMQYRLAKNEKEAKAYFEKLDIRNLNWKQRILTKASRKSLVLLKRIQNLLRRLKINLTPFH